MVPGIKGLRLLYKNTIKKTDSTVCYLTLLLLKTFKALVGP